MAESSNNPIIEQNVHPANQQKNVNLRKTFQSKKNQQGKDLNHSVNVVANHTNDSLPRAVVRHNALVNHNTNQSGRLDDSMVIKGSPSPKPHLGATKLTDFATH